MAYIRNLNDDKCARCKTRRATKEVIDRWNGSCGKFCSGCAKTKLNEKLALEK